MKTIEKQLEELQISLIATIEEMSINTVVERTGLKYQDIQAFLKGRRKWSYEKVLKINRELTR
jgi:hypothetical protein